MLLTPGPFNSAYYEHSFLADKMGVELVEGRDLFVRDNVVYMRTTEGPQRVDVIYRRVDDEFLDPLAFNPASVLGVPGLLSAYKAGNVTLANALGTGVCDDKAIYSYMPEIVKFYLGEEPILEECADLALPRARGLEARARQSERAGRQGGARLGRLRHAGRAARHQGANWQTFARQAQGATRTAFIAQPTLALSTVPCFVDGGIAPRHVDLRPYVLCRAPTACASCRAA